MYTIINVFTLGVLVVALFANLLFSKHHILQRINASIYIIATALYTYITKIIIEYLRFNFNASYTFVDIFNLILTAISAVLGILVIIGAFYKNQKYHSLAYRIFEVLTTVLCGILIFNLITSNKNALFLLPMVIITLVLNFSTAVNASETLELLSSKIYYFVTNIVFAVFWIYCVILLTKTNGFIINNSFYILLTASIVLSTSALVFGLIRIGMGKKK